MENPEITSAVKVKPKKVNPEITDEFLKKYAVEIDGVFYFAKAFASPVAPAIGSSSHCGKGSPKDGEI